MSKKYIAESGNGKKGKFLFMAIDFILTLGCLVFSVLCLYNAQNILLQRNVLLLSFLSSTAFFLLYAVFVWFVYKDRELVYKTILSVVICLLFALVICFILQNGAL